MVKYGQVLVSEEKEGGKKVDKYSGICCVCFEPIEGKPYQLRERGRKFHKDCAERFPGSHYVRLEKRAVEGGKKEKA